MKHKSIFQLIAVILISLLGSQEAFASSYGAVDVRGTAPTYHAASGQVAPAAGCTDIFTIFGSSSKKIKIVRIEASAVISTTTTSNNIPLFLVKRSGANSGSGTVLTDVSSDSTNSAGTAVVTSYTSNPTLGSSAGTVWSGQLIEATSVDENFGTPPTHCIYRATYEEQAITLNSASEGLCVNLNATTPPNSPLMTFKVVWTEE